MAVEKSPYVAAARSRLEAASADVRGARAPYGVVAEVAPGVGYTNGNAFLSHRLDIGGRRAAETRRATGDYSAAQAGLDTARLLAATDARVAYFDLARAEQGQSTANELLEVVRQIRDSVRKRVEIGEVPAVQATRAEIEVARVEQEVVRAGGDVSARRATLNLLLGRTPDAPVNPNDPLDAPAAPVPTDQLMKLSDDSRPELREARARIEASHGSVDVARTKGRPDLAAEIASDIWSMDRRPLQSRNLGLQMRLTIPLVDGGAQRAGVDRARALVREQEAGLEVLRRTISVEVQRAAAELTATRQIVLNYRQSILPRAEELLRTSRAGFEAGLTPFSDVFEAQRVLRLTRTEYQTALYDALRARAALDRAVGAVPGLAPAKP